MLKITIPTLLIKALSSYVIPMSISHKKTTIHPKANAQASVPLHCVQAYTNGGKLIRREVRSGMEKALPCYRDAWYILTGQYLKTQHWTQMI